MSAEGRKYGEFDLSEIALRLGAIKEDGIGSSGEVAGIQCNRHGCRISNSERSSFLLSRVGLFCGF